MADVAYCWEGCGRPATRERLYGMAGEDEVVELVCERHALDGLLACGHVDDDPLVWHRSGRYGEPVCSKCCPECSTKEEDK